MSGNSYHNRFQNENLFQKFYFNQRINIINKIQEKLFGSFKKSKMAHNLKVKIKEFEWFQMQTKVRQIIQQILGPIQKRILETSAVLNKVKTNQIQDELRIQQIVLMVANDPKVFQTGIFATVDQKFVQHSKLIQELKRQIDEENKYIENKFKILDLRMQESSQVLKNIASLKQRVSKEMQIQNDNIMNLRTNFQKMIEDINRDIRETRKQITDNAQICEKKDFSIDEQIRRVKQNILTIEDNVTLHRQMHMDKTMQLQEHERIIQKHNQDIKELFENKYLTKRLGDYVQDMDNQIKKILFKVESIAPLVTQAQISECLTAILPAKIRNKISIYEHKRYFDLNKEVLEKDYKKVENTFKGMDLLQAMQKKCTREIVQLKRKKLLQMGIDIDHATYEQRQKYYSQVTLDDQLNMDYQQTKVTQKMDEGQIKRIMEKFMAEYMSQFKQQIKIQIEDNKKYIYCVQDEIRHEVSRFDKSIDSVKNLCSAFQTQHVLEIKFTNNQIKKCQKLIKNFQEKIIDFHCIQRLFYNFCSLINHLSIQDEIDKQNISLLGSRQSNPDEMGQNKERNSVIALDGKCFSCNGYPATTLTAFKMACLAYHPSSIKIDSKQYKREQLLQFTTNMLQNIKKNIQENTNKSTISNQDNYLATQFDELNSKQFKPASTINIKTLNVNSDQKNVFRNNVISKHLETQDIVNQQRARSNSKYRKKTLNTTYSSSYTKKKSSIKKALLTQEMLKTSTIIFNSLKKKNHSFLN